jgi:hypothetical protein
MSCSDCVNWCVILMCDSYCLYYSTSQLAVPYLPHTFLKDIILLYWPNKMWGNLLPFICSSFPHLLRCNLQCGCMLTAMQPCNILNPVGVGVSGGLLSSTFSGSFSALSFIYFFAGHFVSFFLFVLGPSNITFFKVSDTQARDLLCWCITLPHPQRN